MANRWIEEIPYIRNPWLLATRSTMALATNLAGYLVGLWAGPLRIEETNDLLHGL